MCQPQYSSGPEQPVRPEYNEQSGVPFDPYYEQQFQMPIEQQSMLNEIQSMKDAMTALQIQVAKKRMIVQPRL